MKPYIRKNVPGSNYRCMLAVLGNAATFVFAHPDKAEREAEQALAHVQAYLPQRVQEELRKNNRDDYEHSMARLRMKWDRTNLVILKENLWEHGGASPPIGPAVKMLAQAVKMVIDDLDVAYRKAPPLKGDREEIELIDPVIPASRGETSATDEGDDEVRGDVSYDEMLDT